MKSRCTRGWIAPYNTCAVRDPSSEQALTLLEVAKLYGDIRAYDDSIRSAGTSIDWLSSELGATNPEVIAAQRVLAELLERAGRNEEAAALREKLSRFAEIESLESND